LAFDVFEDRLAGLVIAEAEFDSAADAASLALPPFILHEVSEDDRFTGGRLCEATREELRAWLFEYGIRGTANG
jgi:CYTH domain-containing protein